MPYLALADHLSELAARDRLVLAAAAAVEGGNRGRRSVLGTVAGGVDVAGARDHAIPSTGIPDDRITSTARITNVHVMTARATGFTERRSNQNATALMANKARMR